QFGGESWDAWRALLCGFYALDLNDDERQLFLSITNRTESPQEACEELWLVVGRRGGKTNVAALLAVYAALFFDYRDRLAPGEVATIMVLAENRKQARSCFRFVSGLVASNPMLKAMVVREDRETIEFSNRTVIEIHAASFRAVRGYSAPLCIADELAFWHSDDSANPDYEILNAIRPAMGALDGKLVVLSSPYAKRGELWNTYRRYFGQPGPILVAQAPSRTMNPALSQKVIDRAYERDASAAAAEYGAQFRTDIEAFVPREVVEAATRTEPLELPPEPRITYRAFVDPAGGGRDEFCLAIGHVDGETTVVDVVRGLTGVPADIVAELAELLKRYRVLSATSDRYAGSWPADEFRRHGITVEQAAKPKSDLYKDALAAFNSGQVEIPPDERLINQLCSLERRTARGGRDSIDHPPGGHDDRANVVAGLVAGRDPGSDYTRYLMAAIEDEPIRAVSKRVIPFGIT
ncbi:MAG: terminase large subunit domain-containing protein, partial [Parahaliea sp.]